MIFLLLLFCISSIQVLGHRCIHDELDYTVETLDIWPDSGFVSTTFEPIRIHADFQGIQELDKRARNFIEGDIIPKAIKYFQELLSVIRVPQKLRLNDPICSKATVPEYLLNDGVDADLVLIVTADHCIEVPESAIAWAMSCKRDSRTQRPLAGRINFCIRHLLFDNDEQKRKRFEDTLHEITHILVFAPDHLKNFIDPTTLNRRKDVIGWTGEKLTITTERVVDVAKRYFDCPIITEVELANPGHWEANFLGNEIMTPNDNDNSMSYSSFTIALLEDSGWYKANYAKAQVFSFGRNRGCSFLWGSCINSQTKKPRFEREFCDTQNKKNDICLFDGSYIATCPSPGIYGECPTPRKKAQSRCENGTACFIFSKDERAGVISGFISGNDMRAGLISGNDERAGCHKFKCSTHGYMRKLQVEVNCGFGSSKNVECPVEGGKVRYNCFNFRGAEEYLICPPYDQFCTFDTDIVRPSIQTY